MSAPEPTVRDQVAAMLERLYCFGEAMCESIADNLEDSDLLRPEPDGLRCWGCSAIPEWDEAEFVCAGCGDTFAGRMT